MKLIPKMVITAFPKNQNSLLALSIKN